MLDCLFVCLGCGLASAPLLIPSKCLSQCSQVCPYIRTRVLNKDLLAILGPYYVLIFKKRSLFYPTLQLPAYFF